MPRRHYPPAYLRYLRARLWNLGKPSFWVTAIFISVLGLVIREYWLNPDMFTYQPNLEFTSSGADDSSLSAEDKAIAADIDNLPALFNDFSPISLPPIPSTPQDKSQANNSNKLLEGISKQQPANSTSLGIANGTSVSQAKNPFVLEAENLLQLRAFNNTSQSLGIESGSGSSEPTQAAATSSFSDIGLVNQTANNQNIDLISPLQTQPNQPNSNVFGLNNTASPQINSIGESSNNGGVMQIPSSNISPSQNFTPSAGLNNGGVMQIPPNNISPSPNFAPNTGLNAGTGYLQPNTVNNLPPNSYNNFNGGSPLTSPTLPTAVTSPITSGVQTNMAPPAMQPPSANVVTPMTPVIADRNGNLIWQSPTQQMQSNSSDPRQVPGQDTGRVQNNRPILNLRF
ncbi:hypothetical protein [Nostoc sp. CCY0012]|uniref:hypothetical protein n=1 Tax=Nostoc sp. CCY0012 TaxID=1056123 RepID=UPI0039C5CF3D